MKEVTLNMKRFIKKQTRTVFFTECRGGLWRASKGIETVAESSASSLKYTPNRILASSRERATLKVGYYEIILICTCQLHNFDRKGISLNNTIYYFYIGTTF